MLSVKLLRFYHEVKKNQKNRNLISTGNFESGPEMVEHGSLLVQPQKDLGILTWVEISKEKLCNWTRIGPLKHFQYCL